jgi:hypothetical protein
MLNTRFLESNIEDSNTFVRTYVKCKNRGSDAQVGQPKKHQNTTSLMIKCAKRLFSYHASALLFSTKSEDVLMSLVHEWSRTRIFVAAPRDESPEIVRHG